MRFDSQLALLNRSIGFKKHEKFPIDSPYVTRSRNLCAEELVGETRRDSGRASSGVFKTAPLLVRAKSPESTTAGAA